MIYVIEVSYRATLGLAFKYVDVEGPEDLGPQAERALLAEGMLRADPPGEATARISEYWTRASNQIHVKRDNDNGN